jgi:MRG-binding protein
MIQIQNQLASHGFTSPNLSHTRIPGIWAKLESLYDLEVLDERENNHMGILATPSDSEPSEQDDDEEKQDEDAENPWRRRNFNLPDDEYQELAFSRRLAQDRPSSPEAIEGLSRTRNLLGDDELREKREEYDKGDVNSVRGKGRKATAARATRTRGGRSTRSTPAEGADEDDDVEEEDGSIVGESPQGKGTKKTASRAASTRRSRRR